jgi:hypothetical protein
MNVVRAWLVVSLGLFTGCDTNQQQTLDKRGERSKVLTRDLSAGSIDSNALPGAIDFAIDIKEDELVKGYRAVAKENLASGITFEVVTPPKSVQFIIDAEGLATIVPNPNFSGTDSLTYRFRSAAGESNTAIGTFRVSPVNDLPSASTIDLNGREDESITVDVLKAVSDVDSTDVLKIVKILTPPVNGVASINDQGTAVSFRPQLNFYGRESFRAQVSDGQEGGLVDVQVYVNLAQVNDAPLSENDLYAATEDTNLVISAANGVLRNDQDVDGDALKVSLVTPPARGTLTLNPDGSFLYRPLLNSNLPVSFRYKTVDASGVGAEALAEISIAAVNDRPVAATDTVNTIENLAVDIAALANDSDVDNDVLQVVLLSPASQGTVVPINNSKAFRYTPALNKNGTDSFTYLVKDTSNAVSDAVSVNISISPEISDPIARNDAVSVRSDQTVIIEVLANDEDPDNANNANLIVESVTPGNNFRGELQIETGKRIRFIDVGGNRAATSANFSYVVSRGSGNAKRSATANVTVAIVANNKPVARSVDVQMDEDTTREFNLLDADFTSDQENDPVTVKFARVSPALAGATLTLTGAQVTFQPPKDFFTRTGVAPTVIEYQVNDGRDDSVVGQIRVTVRSVNDAPVADVNLARDEFTVSEDEKLAANGVVSPHVFDVLVNDLDVDGPNGLATKIAPNSLRLLLNGSESSVPGTISIVNNKIHYVAAKNFNGEVTIVYKAQDDANVESVGGIHCYVIVLAENDAPVAVDDGVGEAFVVAEDSAQGRVIDVLVNDSDIDVGDTLIVASVTQTSKGVVTIVDQGRRIRYTPRLNASGPDEFRYTVRDNGGATSASAAVNVSITPVNDRPEANNDEFVAKRGELTTLAVLSNDTDVERSPLSIISISRAPQNGLVLIQNGTIQYFAAQVANSQVEDRFSYKISDGALEDEADVLIRLSDTVFSDGSVSIVPSATALVNQVSVVARTAADETRAVVFSGAPSATAGSTQMMASAIGAVGAFDTSVFAGVVSLGQFAGKMGVGVWENGDPHSIVLSADAGNESVSGVLAVRRLQTGTEICRSEFQVNNGGQQKVISVSKVFQVAGNRGAAVVHYEKESNNTFGWRVYVFNLSDCSLMAESVEMNGELQGLSSFGQDDVFACEKLKIEDSTRPDLSCSRWRVAGDLQSEFAAASSVMTGMKSLQSSVSVSSIKLNERNLYAVVGKLLDANGTPTFELAMEFFAIDGRKFANGITLPELDEVSEEVAWSVNHRLHGISYEFGSNHLALSISEASSAVGATKLIGLSFASAAGGNRIDAKAFPSALELANGESRGDVYIERKSKRIVSVGHKPTNRLRLEGSAGTVVSRTDPSVVLDGASILP